MSESVMWLRTLLVWLADFRVSSPQGSQARLLIFGVKASMAQVSLIDIKSGKLIEHVAGNPTALKAPSIVKISLNPETLKSATRAGSDLVIELTTGEQIVLKGFFIVSADGLRNELVLEHQGKFWHATYEPDQASLSLKEISNVDELLVDDGDNTFMWLLGALGIGGVAALVGGGGGGG
ncbi:BapA/Bap/LapF family prefix-like domain-containing protein, partial [Pseudomonas syringae]|uniref:BapA/Bap/LapF family prefix-like domain-containing protein n=1 Tax=Pseudomonas syringae TaxID=317 RepID=UPI000EFEC1C0